MTSDSHTIPVTVAAEQGVIGLLAYLLLIAAGAWRLAAPGVRRNVRGARDPRGVHRARRAHVGLRGLPRGPGHLGAAGGRQRARARADVLAYLKRLLTAGVAYQAGDILSKGVALFTLPLYTRYVSPAGYGYAETLMTAVILLSIVLRLGVGRGVHPLLLRRRRRERRDRIARVRRRLRLRRPRRRRRARRRRARRSALAGAARVRTTPRCSTSRCSGCGRSPTSRSPTRCCAPTSARAPTCARPSPTSSSRSA